MHRCLELASKGRFSVGINPLVGALLVRDGEVIAEGWHHGFGLDHAEKSLLDTFDQEVQSSDVLYVNLEPCCHQGKTPPCTDVILERGVKHVVYGMQDPNPRVAGEGIELLRSHGVKVTGPVLRAQCEHLNRGYLSVTRKKRPWITLKKAQTRDGRIAHSDGSPLKITSKDQDIWSHTFLRSRHDAILVGVETIIQDDPLLDLRHSITDSDKKNWKVVLDPNARIPSSFQASGDRTLVIQDLPKIDGKFVWEELWQYLLTPREDFPGISSVLVEGGQRTWDNLKKASMIDTEIILTERS